MTTTATTPTTISGCNNSQNATLSTPFSSLVTLTFDLLGQKSQSSRYLKTRDHNIYTISVTTDSILADLSCELHTDRQTGGRTDGRTKATAIPVL